MNMPDSDAILSSLHSRGYWRLAIRPAAYSDSRVKSRSDLAELARECTVRWRGWFYPWHGESDYIGFGDRFIYQAVDWNDKKEYWRFYQSGQFVHHIGLWEDWQDNVTPGGFAKRLDIDPGTELSTINALYLLTEFFEFAARLTARNVIEDACVVTVSLNNSAQRRLVMMDLMRMLNENRVLRLQKVERTETYRAEDLVGKARDLALETALWVFESFSWPNPPRAVFAEDQRRLVERQGAR